MYHWRVLRETDKRPARSGQAQPNSCESIGTAITKSTEYLPFSLCGRQKESESKGEVSDRIVRELSPLLGKFRRMRLWNSPGWPGQ
mmetsp:Transcript_33543/g.77369  ORF Transcript_33543/g.77369 Transcript_33543/m.77369 type:complete len:86 (-) Transcript_33543:454-711(-)